jgi:ATP-binding cassette subfamily B protein
MKLLFNYLKRYTGLIALALVLAAINQIFSFLDPYIFRKIIDTYITPLAEDTQHFTQHEFLTGAGKLVLLAMGVAMVSRIAKNFQDYYVNTITQKLGARIYSDGLAHSLKLPYQIFEDQRSGETLGILQKVRLDTEKLIAAMINVTFTSIVGIIFVSWYSISIHWSIAAAFLSVIPILSVVSTVLSKKIKVIQKKIVAQTAALAGATTESLRNIELVKSLGLANQEISRLNNTTGSILKLELDKVKYLRSLSFIQGTIVNFLRNLILFLMLFLIFTKQISVGEFFSLFLYSFFIFGPLQEVGNIINIYRENEVSLNNFENILATPVERKPKNPVRLDKVATLGFGRVSFRHQTAKRNALSDVSFSVNKGETIAFVGPSGSGKTTLVKLLVGLYQPMEGQVSYNAVSSDLVNLDDLRERIGFVTQDTQLFSGSIRENLLFVRPGASDEECMHALHRAACQSLMDRAENGLDTVIGEGGVKVSGGEKQRLSIARALLRHPDILVFDEATSALDSITEEEITRTIRDVSYGNDHITILIAHRLSTIMHADRIYVLEKGKIAESGRHFELLDEKGLYYAMWRQQIGEREEA